jgi:hypothetical protein
MPSTAQAQDYRRESVVLSLMDANKAIREAPPTVDMVHMWEQAALASIDTAVELHRSDVPTLDPHYQAAARLFWWLTALIPQDHYHAVVSALDAEEIPLPAVI